MEKANNTMPPMYPAEFVERWLGIRGIEDDRFNQTLTDEEIEIIERIVDDHERRWRE